MRSLLSWNGIRSPWVLVTCRTLAYEDPAVRLEGLPDYELARFDEEKVDAFIDAWYRQLDLLGLVKVETAATLAERLRVPCAGADLWRLAPTRCC